jgi:hypothetical protein
VEQGPLYDRAQAVGFDVQFGGVGNVIVKPYLCPSDPSLSNNIQRYGYASTNYAGNMLIFTPKGPGNIVSSMPDGSSNTIMFAERYKLCALYIGSTSQGSTSPGWAVHPANYNVGHAWDTPAFGSHEYYNNTTGFDPNYTGHSPGNPLIGFQNSPAPQACDYTVTQGAHTGGMVVGLGDGSVRTVNTGISLVTWQRACYPNDGLTLGSDW